MMNKKLVTAEQLAKISVTLGSSVWLRDFQTASFICTI